MSWISAGLDAAGQAGVHAGNQIGGVANGLAAHFGNPGHSNFHGTPFQNDPNSGYDPNAFQGGWNDPSNPFSTGNMANQANAAQGAQAPGFAQSQAGFGSLEQMLMGQANGTGPSLAQEQLKQATQGNIANQMAMAAQTRGANPAMQGYNAAQMGGNLNQQAAGQGVQAGIQERLGAMGQLGNVYGMQGQQGMQQQQMNNQLTEYFTSQGMSQEQAQLQAQIAQQQILAGSYNSTQGINAGVSTANAGNSANLIGGILGGLGSLGGSAAGALGGAGAGAGAVAAAHDGAIVPGPDTGLDDHLLRARGQEVVVSPENPAYPMARRAVVEHIMRTQAARRLSAPTRGPIRTDLTADNGGTGG